MCPRDCFFCLKRILIFIYNIYNTYYKNIYNIYNTYYKNIYIIYSIYTSGILEFWIGFFHRVRHDGRRVGETGFGEKRVGIL